MSSEQKEQLKRYLSARKVTKKSDDNEPNGHSSIPKSGGNNRQRSLDRSRMTREKTVATVGTHHPRILPPIARSNSSLSSVDSLAQSRNELQDRDSTKRLPYRMRQFKATLNSLPDELLLKIFGFLSPEELMTCSRVNSHWSGLADDNALWRKILRRHAQKGEKNQDPSPPPNINVPSGYWKRKCISDASRFNSRAVLSKLKKIDPFTGLPASTKSILEKLSMKWVVAFLDEDGTEMKHSFHSDQFSFSMSVCVRWYGVDISSFSLNRLRRIKVYAARPVLHDQAGQPLANSPCKRSLLRDVKFRSWTEWVSSQKLISQDDSLQLYSGEGEFLLGVWKNGGDLAFLALALHKHNLVQSALLGSNCEMCLCPAPKLKFDDIDKEYGLHGYSCTLELRNLRAGVWSEQFTGLFCHARDLQNGFASFQLIDPQRSYQRSSFEKQLCLPWKTEAFHGKIEGTCILDGTVLDDFGNPMWCFSSPVTLATLEVDGMYYEYDGRQGTLEFIEMSHGGVIIQCIWEEATKKYFINDLRLLLSLSHINKWFGVNY